MAIIVVLAVTATLMALLRRPFLRLILTFAVTTLGAFTTSPAFARIGLLARLRVLLLDGAESEAIRRGVEIVILVVFVGGAVLKRKLRLMGRRNQAIIMLRVLEIALRHDRITGDMRIAGKLGIFFGNVLRRTADFDVRPV